MCVYEPVSGCVTVYIFVHPFTPFSTEAYNDNLFKTYLSGCV